MFCVHTPRRLSVLLPVNKLLKKSMFWKLTQFLLAGLYIVIMVIIHSIKKGTVCLHGKCLHGHQCPDMSWWTLHAWRPTQLCGVLVLILHICPHLQTLDLLHLHTPGYTYLHAVMCLAIQERCWLWRCLCTSISARICTRATEEKSWSMISWPVSKLAFHGLK